MSAIRIQRVVLPDKQQFIETSCVSPQGYVKENCLRFFSFYYIIFYCYAKCVISRIEKEKKIEKLAYFVA